MICCRVSKLMDEILGYIKYMIVGLIPTAILISWSEMVMTGGLAVLAGFATALGGFFARLLTNWLKRKWEIFKTEK